MKQSNQKPKKIRKQGSTPIYMRHEVTAYTLREYPQYKHIFHKCPSCGKNSLKPIGLSKINRVIEILEEDKINERHCTICGYIHVKNLSVSTTTSVSTEKNIPVKTGRILEK